MQRSWTKRCIPAFALPMAVAFAATTSARAEDVTSEAQTVAVLDVAVQGLVSDEVLSAPTARPLHAALVRWSRANIAGHARGAALQLAEFARRIDALVRRGILTPEQGDALGTAARAIAESGSRVRGRIAPTGSSGVARGDFDRDGFGDLAIAAPDETVDGRTGAGAVYVVYGTASGLSMTAAQRWTAETVGAATGPARGEHFGSSLASGDFDGDGFTDVAVGVPGAASGAGRLEILYGSAAGLVTGRTEELDVADAALTPQAGASFAAALAWADFDGDGFGDLAVGVPGWSGPVSLTASGAAPSAGLVCIFFGSAEGLLAPSGAAARTPQLVSAHGPTLLSGAEPDPASAGDGFGSALAAGRFDGDRFADLAVGSPFADVTLQTGIEGELLSLPSSTVFFDAGRVHVLSGSASGLDVGSARTFTEDAFLGPGVPGQAGRSDYEDRFGTTLVAGDFDGDGIAGLAIGAPFRDSYDAGVRLADTGAVYVVSPNGPGGLDTPLVQVFAQDASLSETREAGDRFGSALAAGDFDGDGRRDLAIGVPLEDLTSAGGARLHDCGVVHVIHGSDAGLDPSHTQLLRRGGDLDDGATILGDEDASSGDRFGAALTAWNFDAVAPTDLAVGVPYAHVRGRPDAGLVLVAYGTGLGLTGAGSQSWTAGMLGFRDVGHAHFGATLY